MAGTLLFRFFFSNKTNYFQFLFSLFFFSSKYSPCLRNFNITGLVHVSRNLAFTTKHEPSASNMPQTNKHTRGRLKAKGEKQPGSLPKQRACLFFPLLLFFGFLPLPPLYYLASLTSFLVKLWTGKVALLEF